MGKVRYLESVAPKFGGITRLMMMHQKSRERQTNREELAMAAKWVHVTVGTKVDERRNTCYWFLWHQPRSDIYPFIGTCVPTVHRPRALLIVAMIR